ncbi:MAG: hypothetical protein E7Z87_04015 [Cyanobacteria bacterium SIG26]|nr:hypothetical protein [Cyanobacteria bacterium SIG26]
MNNGLKKALISLGYVLGGIYVLFLALPLIISPIINSYCDDIENIIKTTTGFDAKIDKISIITTPNFTAGAKIKNITLSLPDSKTPFLAAENASARMALLPLLAKKIQLANISVDTVAADIVIKKDGSLLLMDYLPENEDSAPSEEIALPLGIKLSNRLPDIKVNDYSLYFTDMRNGRKYGMEGERFRATNIILDKHFKMSTNGKINLADATISNFDIKIDNKIMPDIQLHNLVFPPKETVLEQNTSSTPAPQLTVNIIDIFETIYKNKFHADLTTDIKTSGTLKTPQIKGLISIDELTVAVDEKLLPESYFKINFKGQKSDIDSIFYSSQDKNEKTQIIGEISTGKKPSIDMTFRSNTKFNNIFQLIDSIANSFGFNDLNTLSATGGIDADFNITSNLKKITSNGYLKVIPSTIKYDLYNITIDDINADINFDNNNIEIKKAGLTILGHPLNLYGSIKNDTTTDLTLNADKLSIKGLLATAGQLALLKENDIKNGNISLNATAKGDFKNLKPELNSQIANINILNKPTNTKIALTETIIKFLYDGKTAYGNVNINNFAIINPLATIKIPTTNVLIDSKNIALQNSYIMLNNSRIDLSGAISDYLNNKMNINLSAKGTLNASDVASMLPKEFSSLLSYKGAMPLSVDINGNSKVQNINAQLNADPNNYIALADIDLLKNQNTKIHSNIEIIGDTLNFINTGISNNSSQIAKLSGNITKLYSTPKLNIGINVPNQVSFPIWGVPNSNISAIGSAAITGDITNPQMSGTINVSDISMKDMDFSISHLSADLAGAILNGTARAKQFKFGGIVATDLAGKFTLKDYNIFSLINATGKAFDGDISGNLSYTINNAKTAVDFKGEKLNSTKAVEGAVGIPNALTGLMNFDGKLTMQGITDKEIINSLNGNINFDIGEGKFISIGKLENLVAAQNVSANSILKSALSAISSLTTIQEADKYKYINGNLTFANGAAKINKINVAGPLMAYYVNGTFNILPNTANMIILGRLDSKVVSLLGPLGELSAEKLLSYIPKFGSMTANMLNQLTTNPANENLSLIPALSSGSTNYKDFKVIFNGSVTSASSMKSFKWLSTCDTTEIDIKDELNKAQETIKTNVQNVKKDFEQAKADIQKAKEQAKQSSENLKNLFKNVIKN